jgi:hypothetical protein
MPRNTDDKNTKPMAFEKKGLLVSSQLSGLFNTPEEYKKAREEEEKQLSEHHGIPTTTL